jgi:hypothetical protein
MQYRVDLEGVARVEHDTEQSCRRVHCVVHVEAKDRDEAALMAVDCAPRGMIGIRAMSSGSNAVEVLEGLVVIDVVESQ